MMPALINLIGKRFGRLEVISRHPEKLNGLVSWVCRCDCGENCIVRGHHLRGALQISCGCFRNELTREKGKASATHGHFRNRSVTPERVAYHGMMQRCYDPKYTNFKYWGGRGIKVCDRWRNSFVDFLADMGPRPSEAHSIDRYPDPDGNYEPGNCRWATRIQQRANRSAA
jgi:hypothetical protein